MLGPSASEFTEDILQQAYAICLRKQGDKPSVLIEKPTSFIVGVIRKLVLEHFRDLKSEREHLSEYARLNFKRNSSGQMVDTKDVIKVKGIFSAEEMLVGIFEGIPEKHKLTLIQELEREEAGVIGDEWARKLGVDPRTYRTQVHRAKEYIRKNFKPYQMVKKNN